jgi:hypothetical protein
MMRYVTVYALNNTDDAIKASEALMSIKPLLPINVKMHVYATGSVDEKEVQIPSWVFGELVMVLNFDDQGDSAYTAYEAFRKSEAFTELKRRTKGLFSNETLTNYFYE